nr:hypothetical protein [Suaeda aralocaspica]
MFPFQRSCELSFKISDEGDQYEQIDNLENQILLDSNNNSNSNFGVGVGSSTVDVNPGRGRGRGRGRGERPLSSSSLAGTSNNNNTNQNNNNNNNNDENDKKIVHREYERQRRQEMANLYNSLRTILPSEYTQGKRSISDHVGEAINYITDLKKNVKELEEKRDELKQSTITTSSVHELGESSSAAGLPAGSRCNVLIRESVVGIEIEISIANEDEDRFSLSSALQIVFDHGLEVVICTSTNFNHRLIHNLQCQVGNTKYIDVNNLQQRLTDLLS